MPVEEKDKIGQEPKGEQTPPKKEESNVIQQIQDLKRNTVAKAEYERMVKERDDAVKERDDAYKAMLDGKVVTLEKTEDRKKVIADLRKELYGKSVADSGMKNLDYIEKTLKLRNALIEEGEDDPFLGVIKEGTVLEDSDYEKAQKVADTLQGIVDDARKAGENGDDPHAVFKALYDSRIAEGTVPRGKGGRR